MLCTRKVHNFLIINDVIKKTLFYFIPWNFLYKESRPKKTGIFYDNLSKANSKHDFFPKRNYDKRVFTRIFIQNIKTMNNSLFIEKYCSIPTDFKFIFIFLNLKCLINHLSIYNVKNEAIGTKFNFDICHNYWKVGGCLNCDNFVINIYGIIW